MILNDDFGQKYYSRTAESINKIRHDSIQLRKCSALYDKSHYEKKLF